MFDNNVRPALFIGFVALFLGTSVLPGMAAKSHVLPLRHPRPAITLLQPNSFEFTIPHPASGSYPKQVSLSITGTGFRTGAVVLFNHKPVPTTFVSPKNLTAQVPFKWVSSVADGNGANGPDSFHGDAKVTVQNPGNPKQTSNAKLFHVSATPIE